MSQSDDIKAIDDYIRRTVPATAKADQLQNAWIQWVEGLGMLETSFDSGVLAEAKQRRDAFNAANILTATSAPNLSGKTVMASNTPILLPGTRPTIREGSSGAAVGEWQRVIGVDDDGKFGPKTKAATISWQKARGLDADGVVGPMTWGKAIEESATAAVSSTSSTVAAIAQQAAAAVAAVTNTPPPTPAQVEQVAHQAAAAANPKPPAPKPPTPAPVIVMPANVIDTFKSTLDRLNATTPVWAKVAGGALAGVAAIVGMRAAGKR